MKGEILTIETAEKLARLEKTTKYLNDVLKNAYNKYNLNSIVFMELLKIECMLTGKEIK